MFLNRLGQPSTNMPPVGLYLEGLFNGRFFALQVWLIFGRAYFRNFTVISVKCLFSKKYEL